MKAIVYDKYGPPELLHLEEVEKPSPADDQVLIRVCAASVNAMDWRGFTMSPIFVRIIGGGWRKPKDPRLGADVAGVVEAVGSQVSAFRPGDEVFGVCSGSFAEYACARELKLERKPANISFEAAAATPVAAFTALQGLRDKGRIRAGERVLIDGAGGGVGTFAVQIAKSFGTEVTAVCSTANQQMARSIGADHVIDYMKEDFTQRGERYDLIFAVNGYHPMQSYLRALCPSGRCIVAGGAMAQIMQSMLLGRWLSKQGGKTIANMGIAHTPHGDLVILRELLESGKVVPVIHRTYPLSQVPEAIRYLTQGHSGGKVVITMGE